MNWMGGLSLLLFWMPIVGPLVAGLVGGKKAGSVKRAVIAVFLPALLLGLLVTAGQSARGTAKRHSFKSISIPHEPLIRAYLAWLARRPIFGRL